MKKIIPMLLASSVVGLSGCGGGGGTETTTAGGGGTVAGLDMPVTLSVVTAKETTTSGRQVAALNVNYAAVIAALTDPSSDYTTDPQNKWVHDRALEPLNEVNNILCYIGQTGADKLVNKTYTALVDSSKCERQGKAGGGQNQSSGGGKTVELEKWTVESTRTDNNSPQIVRIWATGGGGGGGQNGPDTEIRAEVTIAEGVSSTNPFGKFTLNFAGIAAAAWSNPMDPTKSVTKGQVLESGTLKTVDAINGKVGFTMYQGSPMFGQERKVSVVTDTDQSTGVALTGGTEMDYKTMPPTPTSKAFAVAFNPSNILVLRDAAVADLGSVVNIVEGGTVGTGGAMSQPAACLSRTAFNHNVWRYNLYNAADGSRVKLNSGFPFQWDSDANGTNDSFGYVSYWGIWSEKTPSSGSWNGTIIAKDQHGQVGAAQTYTVVESPGKLIKSEKSTLALSGLDGETFNFWDSASGKQYKVEYDVGTGTGGGTVSTGSTGGTTPGFYKTHELVFSPNSPPTETALTPNPVRIDTTQQQYQWIGMYSESLGGQVNYHNTDTTITFFKESNVDGNDAAFSSASTINLDCFTRCLKPNLTATEYENSNNWSLVPGTTGSPYYADATNPMPGNNAVPAATYRFDKATLALTINGDSTMTVKVPDNYAYVTPNSNPEPWGINTNAMVPATTPMANIYDTWGQSVSYRWETGHKSWNKVVRVKDANGAQVAFDKPLNVTYKHLTANDANASSSFNGKNVALQYGGDGDLWGIPWIDPTTGKQCLNNPQDCRPAFALKDGTLMGASSEYAVKAIDMELSPVVAAGACSALVLNQPAAPLPTAKSGDPSNVATAAPTPADPAPAVIGGVVQ